jgi:serine phosphatase RsbU (regulator of sigma subunit)
MSLKKLKSNVFYTYLTLISIIFSPAVEAQEGDFFISNYDKSQYNGASQNFDVIEDDFGLLYFANNSSIIEYDSKVFRNINLTENKTPICFAKSRDGKIFVGGENEIGCLAKSANGRLYYESLVHLVPKEERVFTKVWYASEHNGAIYFCANELLMRLKDGKIKTWKPKSSFHKIHVVNGILFIRELGTGLMMLKNESLVAIAGTEIFAGVDYKIANIIPGVREKEFTIVTRKKGIFSIIIEPRSNSAFVKNITDGDHQFLTNNEPFDAIKTSKYIIIATKTAGVFVFDLHFNLIQNITIKNGLISKSCNKLYFDKEENLWCAFDNGLSKIEINLAIKKWDKSNSIESSIESFAALNGRFFLGTLQGLLEYSKEDRSFKKINDITDHCFDLKVVNGKLFVGTEAGLYVYDGKSFHLVFENSAVHKIYYQTAYSRAIICCTDEGVVFLDKENYSVIKSIQSPLKSEIKSIAFINEHVFAASSRSEGMFYHNQLKNQTAIFPPDKNYLPHSENELFTYNNKALISTDSGVFVIRPDLKLVGIDTINKYVKYYALSKVRIHDSVVYCSGTKNNKEEIFHINLKRKSKKINNLLSRIGEVSAKEFILLGNKIYIPTDEGLYIYDLFEYQKEQQSLVNLASITFGKDTLLNNVHQSVSVPEIKYDKNDVTFTFGSNDYSAESKLQFSYFLNGIEKGFSDWTPYHVKTYNNLQEGNYTFYIRLKNIYGNVSETLKFTFSIAPPWYRSLIAYFIYFLFLVSFILLVIKLNVKRLTAVNKKLEKTIEERTELVRNQKAELEKQKHSLEEKQKEIVDSINYAKRIQFSLLAQSTFLNEHLQNHFVFFQPKDIVSGDFYWATEKENRFYLAVCDSTGHGVPGAFMSLLSIGFLSEAINEKGISAPNIVFNYIRDRLAENINKQDQKDGFDGILICFDRNNGIITYAAANNSPLIIQNGVSIDLEADKMPVGIGERKESFRLLTINYQPGDVLYLYTDGYADQFGGPKGKKFKYKQLDELLINIHKNPPSNQGELLEKAFMNWKGELEQIDDVLIVGMRL